MPDNSHIDPAHHASSCECDGCRDWRKKYQRGIDPRDMRISKLENGLRHCIARAGISDPVEACRAVIKTAEDALKL